MNSSRLGITLEEVWRSVDYSREIFESRAFAVGFAISSFNTIALTIQILDEAYLHLESLDSFTGFLAIIALTLCLVQVSAPASAVNGMNMKLKMRTKSTNIKKHSDDRTNTTDDDTPVVSIDDCSRAGDVTVTPNIQNKQMLPKEEATIVEIQGGRSKKSTATLHLAVLWLILPSYTSWSVFVFVRISSVIKDDIEKLKEMDTLDSEGLKSILLLALPLTFGAAGLILMMIEIINILIRRLFYKDSQRSYFHKRCFASLSHVKSMFAIHTERLNNSPKHRQNEVKLLTMPTNINVRDHTTFQMDDLYTKAERISNNGTKEMSFYESYKSQLVLFFLPRAQHVNIRESHHQSFFLPSRVIFSNVMGLELATGVLIYLLYIAFYVRIHTLQVMLIFITYKSDENNE